MHLVALGLDGDDPDGSTSCLDKSGFADAVQLAKKADVAVVFVGLTPGQMKNNTSDAREDEGLGSTYYNIARQSRSAY